MRSAFLNSNFKRDQKVMKLVLLLCFIALFVLLGAGIKKPSVAVMVKQSIILNDTIDFTNQIQPILVSYCSPCHFPGGKMYQRMPFDKDTTIINHEAGILRRIKGDDNALIKAFVQQGKR